MDIRPIRTDEEHRAALAAIEACWGAPEGTEEGDTLDVLLDWLYWVDRKYEL